MITDGQRELIEMLIIAIAIGAVGLIGHLVIELIYVAGKARETKKIIKTKTDELNKLKQEQD